MGRGVEQTNKCATLRPHLLGKSGHLSKNGGSGGTPLIAAQAAGGFPHQATPTGRTVLALAGPEVEEELFALGLTCSTALTLSTVPPPWLTICDLSVEVTCTPPVLVLLVAPNQMAPRRE
jgi:hypothetical protein